MKLRERVFRDKFFSKKGRKKRKEKLAGQTVILYYYPRVQAGIGRCTIQLLRRHTEITYLRGTLVSSFSFFPLSTGGGGGAFRADTRMNDERMCF